MSIFYENICNQRLCFRLKTGLTFFLCFSRFSSFWSHFLAHSRASTSHMINFAVFKQGRERCVTLTDMISNIEYREGLSRISDAVNLALSLNESGIQQDGGNNCSTYISVCGHCLGNIRGQCCASCRRVENAARKAFASFEGSRDYVLTERDDIFVTAAVILDFMKVRHGWSTFNWTENIVRSIGSDKLQRIYEELDSILNTKSNAFKLHTILENSAMSIGYNDVQLWSPTLIKNIFNDKLSKILFDESPATPTQCSTENDINMLFSEEEMDVTILFQDNEPMIEMIDADKTCARLQQNLNGEETKHDHERNQCERIMVDHDTLLRNTIFKQMQKTKEYTSFIQNTILLPEKKKFKDPLHCKFLHDFLHVEFEFKFDTSNYAPEQMISELLCTDRFLSFIKSIVPNKIDSLDKAFYFVNQNLLC